MAFFERYEAISSLTPKCIRVRDNRTGSLVLVHKGPVRPDILNSWEQSGKLLGKEQEGGIDYTLTIDSPDVLASLTNIPSAVPAAVGDSTTMFQPPVSSTLTETRLAPVWNPSHSGLDATRAIPTIPQQQDTSPQPIAHLLNLGGGLTHWQSQQPVDLPAQLRTRGVVSRAVPPGGGATGFFAAPPNLFQDQAPPYYRSQIPDTDAPPPSPEARLSAFPLPWAVAAIVAMGAAAGALILIVFR